jgi:hypothetical protein
VTLETERRLVEATQNQPLGIVLESQGSLARDELFLCCQRERRHAVVPAKQLESRLGDGLAE